jgi:hypothetical protein
MKAGGGEGRLGRVLGLLLGGAALTLGSVGACSVGDSFIHGYDQIGWMLACVAASFVGAILSVVGVVAARRAGHRGAGPRLALVGTLLMPAAGWVGIRMPPFGVLLGVLGVALAAGGVFLTRRSAGS